VSAERAARVGDRVGAHGTGRGAESALLARAAADGDMGAVVRTAAGAGAGSCGEIVTGAATVFIEGQPAARVSDPVTHGRARLREGSSTVFINGRPASREGDLSTCGGQVVTHASRTFVGGPPASEPAPLAPDRTAMVGAILAGMSRARETRDRSREIQVADASDESNTPGAAAVGARVGSAVCAAGRR
jgi:uncharacterized Zn-binding protein involved in type VI secretion